MPPNAKLASFDVVSLFTNIDVGSCKDVVNRLIHRSTLDVFEKDELCNLMSICMDQNYFLFEGKYYTQPGVAMGSPLSPLLADIYMDYLEEKILSKLKTSNLLYWYRYVDDIIILWVGTERQLNKFHENLNSLDPHIKFTIEFGGEHLNFLDLSINLLNNRHVFSIFRKSTYSDITIHNSSNHPQAHKHAAFHSMVNRALSIPMSDENLSKEKSVIKTIAISNGYDGDLINRIWGKVLRKKSREGVSNLVRDREDLPEDMKWVSIPYYGKISDKLGKILTSRGFKVGFKNKNNLKSALGSVKDKIAISSRSGVYKLTCSCGLEYIGQTGRKFTERIGEHKDDHRLGRNKTFAKHLNDFDHTCSFDLSDKQSVNFLHFCSKGGMLNVLEDLEIMKSERAEKCLNEVIPQRSSPLFNMFV